MKFWTLILAGSSAMILALLAVARIPAKAVDIYYRDTYMVVPKTTLYIALSLALTALAAATIRRLRTR
jgi:hypothetical protein